MNRALWDHCKPEAVMILIWTGGREAVPEEVFQETLDALGLRDPESGKPDLQWAKRELDRWKNARYPSSE